MNWKKRVVKVLMAGVALFACFLGGWWIGYNDGTITTIAVGREYVSQNEMLWTTVKADKAKWDILQMRLSGKMNDWKDEE